MGTKLYMSYSYRLNCLSFYKALYILLSEQGLEMPTCIINTILCNYIWLNVLSWILLNILNLVGNLLKILLPNFSLIEYEVSHKTMLGIWSKLCLTGILWKVSAIIHTLLAVLTVLSLTHKYAGMIFQIVPGCRKWF